MKWTLLIASTLVSAGLFAQDASQAVKPPAAADPPALGLHFAKGAVPAAARTAARTRNVNMVWHNGAVMNNAAVTAIFWGPTWNNATFAADKFSGMDSWYGGWAGSNYAKTNTEYTGSGGTRVTTSLSYSGHIVDTSTASNGSSTSTILAEVCKVIKTPVANGYYPVYVDVKRGTAGFCAYHSFGTCGTTPVQFGFFFNLDGDAGCDPQDTRTTHSQGLEAIANVSGHELSEMLTDPRNGGWYDQQGNENGDKCAWTFNVPFVTFSNGDTWKIQGEWSNAAFTAGTGYPNSSGQRGCLDGH
jgi:hypothetical protein